MSNVPNQQEGQSVFHQTPLNADEDELVNQSEIAPSFTPALKPFCFPGNFTQSALIGREVRQETSQPLCHLFRIFPLKCLFNFDIHIKSPRGFPHYMPEPASQVQEKSEICGTKLKETLKLTLLSCNVTFTDSQACEYWPCEGRLSSAERRHGISQLRLQIDQTLNMT